jgi:hypothetical protein
MNLLEAIAFCLMLGQPLFRELLKARSAVALDEVEILVFKGDQVPTPTTTVVGECGAFVPFFR